MILTGIISNISFLIVLSFLYSFIYKQQSKINTKIHSILNGVLFGLIALAGMIVPLRFSPGVIFDGRSIVISIGAYFGGPIVAIISASIAGVYRYILGGAGTFVGISVIVNSALIGLLYRYIFDRNTSRKVIPLYLFGLAVHIFMMLLMFLLPGKASADVVRELTIPVLIVYPLATILVAKLLIDRETFVDNQQKISTSQQKFKSIFESANVGKSITQPSGEIDVNKAFCDMLGYTQEELQHKKWQDITPPDEIAHVEKLIDPLLKGETDSVRFEKRYICKDCSEIWADVSTSLQRDQNGRPMHFITTVVPIDAQKRAQEELKRLKDELEIQVSEKTRELQERVEELEKFHDATVEREIRMNEMREELNRLKKEKDGE